MAGVGILHPSDPLKSGSGGKWCRKWCPKKPSSQKNGISGGGGFGSLSSSNPRLKNYKNSKEEKAITAITSAPKMEERYSGWSFFTSPPPSSIPLPAFLTKNAAAAAAGN